MNNQIAETISVLPAWSTTYDALIEENVSDQPIQVLIVDDQAWVRKAMRALIQAYDDIHIVAEAPNARLGVQLAGQLEPNIILMDLIMPDMDGVEAITRILAVRPQQRIIVLTAYFDIDQLLAAMQAGAINFVSKMSQPEELIQAIRNSHSGEPSLTPGHVELLPQNKNRKTFESEGSTLTEPEHEVLRLLSLGKTDWEIAEQLRISVGNVQENVGRIKTKLRLKNRVHVALYGIQLGVHQN